MPEVRVGISGWTYPAWRGTFYPKGLPHRRELEYAASRLCSVEINGSFYALQRPESYRAWHAQTPPGFRFAVKGGRFITHMKKLRDVGTALANFYASGVLALEDKLGPFLWQLPPQLPFDPVRLDGFLAQLPRTTADAAALAAGHDERLEGRSLTECVTRAPLRHALEVRHDSYVTPAFLELLVRHDVGLVVADTAGRWPFLTDVTSDFVYVRLHGAEELYVTGYDTDALTGWAARVSRWVEQGRDVYVYFDNDVKVRAPYDAMALSAMLGVAPPDAPVAASVPETRSGT